MRGDAMSTFADYGQAVPHALGSYVPRGDLSKCSKHRSYSTTSSAIASSVGGTVMPSALAVLRLMTRSYLVSA
jgi:hypothetical protein